MSRTLTRNPELAPVPPVTIGDLKRDGKLLELECSHCHRHLYEDPAKFPLDDADQCLAWRGGSNARSAAPAILTAKNVIIKYWCSQVDAPDGWDPSRWAYLFDEGSSMTGLPMRGSMRLGARWSRKRRLKKTGKRWHKTLREDRAAMSMLDRSGRHGRVIRLGVDRSSQGTAVCRVRLGAVAIQQPA
jgi:hypothetical protein